MEYKSKIVYIVLISLVIVVLLLLEYINRDNKRQSSAVESEVKTANQANVDHIKNNSMMVYINWDGFAWYYYAMANSGESEGTPVLNKLIKEGVLFSDTHTGIPSITNPMQTSIVTGAWPSVTGNCYRYFDRYSSKVLKTKRDNKAETIAEAITRQGLRAVSIHQFILENRGTYAASKENPYIQLGNNADYADRFNQAIRFVKSSSSSLPALLAIYMDDLDGIGHNSWYTYGVPPVKTEKERLESVTRRLKLMDAKLGEFIQACKAAGIYDKISFLLTSDHGMTPYGSQDTGVEGDGYSRLPDLVKELQYLGYKVEVVIEGKSPKAGTEVVLTTTGLEVQLFFTGKYDDSASDRISAALRQKKYVGIVMDKAELKERGAADEFADLLISPKPPFCFKNDNKLHKAGGQHDSLDESSQHVFALMWGKGIKKGFNYERRAYVIDFAETLSSLAGIDSPKDSTGQLLKGALE